jgi:hypothetical protein
MRKAHHHELNEDSSWYLEVGAQHHLANGHILKTKKDDRSLKITQNSIKELAVPSEHTQGLLLCRGTRHGIYIGEGHQCWEIFIQFVTLDLIHGIEIDSTTLNGRHSINV